MRFFCIKKIYCYFREYIESILLPNDKVIFFEENKQISIEDDNISNVFLCKIPDFNYITIENKNNNPINIFYLNTEQFTRPDMKKFVIQNVLNLINLSKKYLNVSIKIIDYSNQNIKLLKDTNILKDVDIYYIPYQYNENENKKLSAFSKKKTYDIAYCGCDSPYRINIINKIKNNIVSKKVIGWNDDRDMEIGKAKILINIHYNNNYNIYESIRCDRWLFSENIVLSENSIMDNLLDVKELLVISPYDNLIEMSSKIIKNYDKYRKLYFNDKKKEIIKNIINNRKQIYDEFRKMYF